MPGMITFEGSFASETMPAIEVPAQVLDSLGSQTKRAPVRVEINGVELRTTLAVYGGRVYVGLRREMREAMRVAPGETISVGIALDAEPRLVELPDDLAAALAADPEAGRAFDRLSLTNRREYVEWITGAKRAATRRERLAKAPALLRHGRRTPL